MVGDMTSSSFMMIMMACLLGIRHGFDLDHLATIDAITQSSKKESLSRFVGCFFSLGHGAVITAISFLLSMQQIKLITPLWLDTVGKSISIFFLCIFGFINLLSVCKKESLSKVPVGIKSFLSKILITRALSPWHIFGVGALFAISFDTISQIALFSLSASYVTGQYFAMLLGLSFTLGMLVADGVNGLIVAMLIQKADRLSFVASKGLALLIALFSLFLGITSLIQLFL
jgi:high-affinity nickel-transport protein